MENNDNERSTLFTARSTENAMTFFTVVGFLTLAVIFVYHRFHENEKWDAALILVWERVPPRAFVFNTVDDFQGRSRCDADAFTRISR